MTDKKLPFIFTEESKFDENDLTPVIRRRTIPESKDLLMCEHHPLLPYYLIDKKPNCLPKKIKSIDDLTKIIEYSQIVKSAGIFITLFYLLKN